QTFIPVNIIGNLYVSNGMAAGNTLMEARTQALSEIFERSVKYRIISQGLCLPEVPDEVIARYPNIQAGIAGLRKAGFGILVKDASLGGHYPVMNVTLVHPKDQGIFSSYGAHPRFEIALERAMTELLQGRALDSLQGFPEPSFDMDEINAVSNLEIHFVDSSGVVSWNFMRDTPDFPFADWNFSATTEEDYNWLVNSIHSEGKDIYVADFSEQGAYSCRILVPGMSEIYPPEDLDWENNSIGNAIRPALLRLSDLSAPEATELLADLQTMNLNDERPLWEILGLAIPMGTPWKQLRIGELKTLLALAIGDEEAIREGCDWIHHFNDLEPARRLVYRCIESMLNVDNVDDYRRSLVLLYSAETVRQAEALLNRSERFFGLETLGTDMQGSPMHQTLLAAYDKLFA
ncbi:MAG TPA: YcaO-like family protein, partial [Candidimonas sp.]|nr:YcaO-like family protein [Candidimonas sp.]